MYAREHRVLLRHYLELGLSKTALARTLRVSRARSTTGSTPGSWTGNSMMAPCSTRRDRPWRARSTATARSSKRDWRSILDSAPPGCGRRSAPLVTPAATAR